MPKPLPSKKSSWTHASLVTKACAWVRTRGYRVVLSELGSTTKHGEMPDVIGWNGSKSIVVECKISRADFLADQAKPFRQAPDNGMGRQRYYFVPSGLLTEKDVEACGWGLVVVTGRLVHVRVPSKDFKTRSMVSEMMMLYTALQRVQFRVHVPLSDLVSWSHYGKKVHPLEEVPERFEAL